jgi:hypothetical protein
VFELVAGEAVVAAGFRAVSGLVRGREGEFGFLGAKVFEARLEPREPLVAALG